MSKSKKAYPWHLQEPPCYRELDAIYGIHIAEPSLNFHIHYSMSNFQTPE